MLGFLRWQVCRRGRREGRVGRHLYVEFSSLTGLSARKARGACQPSFLHPPPSSFPTLLIGNPSSSWKFPDGFRIKDVRNDSRGKLAGDGWPDGAGWPEVPSCHSRRLLAGTQASVAWASSAHGTRGMDSATGRPAALAPLWRGMTDDL